MQILVDQAALEVLTQAAAPVSELEDAALEACKDALIDAQHQWRTIDSAPKDGTLILCLLGDKFFRPFLCTWAEGWAAVYPGHENEWDRYLEDQPPTLWMPIPRRPTPPTDSKKQQA